MPYFIHPSILKSLGVETDSGFQRKFYHFSQVESLQGRLIIDPSFPVSASLVALPEVGLITGLKCRRKQKKLLGSSHWITTSCGDSEP